MLDKNKLYSYKELNDLYNMLNIEFMYFGQNQKGHLVLYVQDTNKIYAFTSNNNGKNKKRYLNYSKEEIDNLKFKFDKEVDILDYDINIIVNNSSNPKIPSGRYSLETLNNLTIENDDFHIDNEEQINGIDYIVVERENNSTLFNGRYLFGNNGLIYDIENNLLPQYELERNEIATSNIKAILQIFKQHDKGLEMID